MRLLALLLLGVAVGVALTAIAHIRTSGPPGVFPILLLAARVLLLVLAVGYCARNFGPAAGFAVLAGAVVSRAWLARSAFGGAGAAR
jgi:hypothetical protein